MFRFGISFKLYAFKERDVEIVPNPAFGVIKEWKALCSFAGSSNFEQRRQVEK